MSTRIWLLSRKSDNPEWDTASGFVVRASSEKTARNLASSDAGDEGKNTWTDPKLSVCEELTMSGPEEIILRDFCNG